MQKFLNYSEDDFRETLDKVAKKYYKTGEEAATGVLSSNRAFSRLKYYAKRSRRILECGCGAGTTLQLCWQPKAQFTGLDISRYAIRKAKIKWKNKRNVRLMVGDVRNLPFVKESFDFVFSAYVLEHVINVQNMVDEMVRVLKKRGKILLIAPNYGSPIEFSPSFEMVGIKPLLHSIKLLMLSHLWLILPPKNLIWNQVEPLIIKTKEYFPDSDTVVEPYIQTLATYLGKKNIKIREISSGLDWPQANGNLKFTNLPIKYKLFAFAKRTVIELGKRGINPYKYYGSTLFIVGEKL